MGVHAYVILLAPVPALVAAVDAALQNTQVALLVVDIHSCHQPATRGRAVARVDVHVPAPEARGTMVGVSVSLDDVPAVTAGEVLGAALELLGLATGHGCVSITISVVSITPRTAVPAAITVTVTATIVAVLSTGIAANVYVVARPVPIAGSSYRRAIAKRRVVIFAVTGVSREGGGGGRVQRFHSSSCGPDVRSRRVDVATGGHHIGDEGGNTQNCL